MRRSLALIPSLILATTLAMTSTPAFAASHAPVSKSSVSASTISKPAPTPEILPLRIVETVNPGQTITVPLTLIHSNSKDSIGLIPAGNAELGGLGYPTQASALDAQWLPDGATSLKIDGPTSAALTIHVPSHIAPGLYEAGLAESEPAKLMNHASNPKISSEISVTERIVAPILLTVTGPVAPAPARLNVVSASTAQGEASIIEVQNPAHQVASAPMPVSLTVSKNGQTIVSAREIFANIQPASTAISPPIPWKFALTPGTYTVTISAKGLGPVSKTVTISAPIAKKANQNSSGYYHVKNVATGISLIEVIASGAGIVILALLIALWMMLKRRKQD